MRSLRRLASATVCLLLVAAARPAALAKETKGLPDDAERVADAQYDPAFRIAVGEAIDRGVRWLRNRQQADGSFAIDYARGHPLGANALATLTLLKAGVAPDAPCMDKAFDFLRRQPIRRTYSLGLLLMAIEARYAPARDPFAVDGADRYGNRTAKEPCAKHITKQDLAWMRLATERLIAGQGTKGLWTYDRTVPSGSTHGADRRHPGMNPHTAAMWDLSNTQYALLGLHAASRCHVKVPRRVWLDALNALLAHQQPVGPPVLYKANEVRGRYRFEWTEPSVARGFGYREAPTQMGARQPDITGSMTTAGLAGLVICQSRLWKSRSFTGRLRADTRRGIRDGMAWMQRNFAVDENPVRTANDEPRAGGRWHRYYLYGLERAGVLARKRHFGDIDWYKRGADYLIATQTRLHGKGDMAYWAPGGTDTCFALLFLRRATSQLRRPVITPRSE